jgi:hypothetical protein
MFVLLVGRLPFTNTAPHHQLVQHDLDNGQQQDTKTSQGQISILQQRVAATQQELLAQQVEQRRHELQLALIEAGKMREELESLRQQRQIAEARLQQLTSDAAVLEAKQAESAHCPAPSGRSGPRGSRKVQRSVTNAAGEAAQHSQQVLRR